MRWPRGKYNGRRIVGVVVTCRLDVRLWGLALPNLHYGRCLWIGPLRLWFEAEYARD